MNHIELHIINNEADAIQAEETGLTTFGVFEVCENCNEAIGYTPNGFYPCVIVLSTDENDEDVEFLLCDGCVSPILSPNYIN
jgi:hypothetical protein